MSLKNCIINGQAEGKITKEQADQALDLFEDLAAEYQGRMSREVAEVQAGRDAYDALAYEAMQRKRQKLLQYQTWKRLKSQMGPSPPHQDRVAKRHSSV